MDSYFGKIKSKKIVPFQYQYNNYREYLNIQHNHIRCLENYIDILIQDIILLDNKIKNISNKKE
jgi:hypothetical protein